MNKTLKCLSVLSTLSVLVACGNRTKIGVDQKGANTNPVSVTEDSVQITMGDVMPFYDNGVMNIYHLRNVSGGNSLFYHPIARISTRDFIHYENNGIALNYEEKIESIDAALGTGSFIKDKDGLYHAFYTGHNGKSGEQETLLRDEAVRHATSRDQVHWEKDEAFTMWGYENDFRDPYVYWDDIDETYYMLVTTRDYGKAVIKRYSAPTLSAKKALRDDEKVNLSEAELNEVRWVEDEHIFYTNTDNDFNMECSSVIKFGDYYYLSYSEQSDQEANRVTRYRVSSSHDFEWVKPERDTIDSVGFYAGRLEKTEDKLYAFAWCARLTGGNTGSFDWGGNLVTHELAQDAETGELHAVMPNTYRTYFSNEMDVMTVDGQKLESFESDGQAFDAVGIKKSNENVNRFSMKITPKELKGNFGISFGLDGDYNKRLGSSLISFDLEEGKVIAYNNVSNILRYGKPLTRTAFTFEADKTYDVDLVMDGEIVTVWVNNDIALTARFIDIQEANVALYSNGANASITEVHRYE